MYESISVVGERGQITIPKIIRDIEGINEKDRVLIKIEDGKVVIEKITQEKQTKKELVEGYKKTAKLSELVNDEWSAADKESNGYLDEY